MTATVNRIASVAALALAVLPAIVLAALSQASGVIG